MAHAKALWTTLPSYQGGQYCGNTTHAQLVKAGAEWMAKYCDVVITEIASCASEEPDVIGWKNGYSKLIECKATRSDFLADKVKPFRVVPESGMGRERYYLAPVGLIGRHELPEGWGLLEYHAQTGKVKRLVSCGFFESHPLKEVRILISALRRIGVHAPNGFSIRCYNIETKNRATLGVRKEEQP